MMIIKISTYSMDPVSYNYFFFNYQWEMFTTRIRSLFIDFVCKHWLTEVLLYLSSFTIRKYPREHSLFSSLTVTFRLHNPSFGERILIIFIFFLVAHLLHRPRGAISVTITMISKNSVGEIS